jgi:hypothetical protein
MSGAVKVSRLVSILSGSITVVLAILVLQSYFDDTVYCLSDGTVQREWCLHRGGVWELAEWFHPPPRFRWVQYAAEDGIEGQVLLRLPTLIVIFVVLGAGTVIAPRVIMRRVVGFRRKHGLCERCGYDLRGSTSTRCPECGNRVPNPPAAKAVGRGA